MSRQNWSSYSTPRLNPNPYSTPAPARRGPTQLSLHLGDICNATALYALIRKRDEDRAWALRGRQTRRGGRTR